MVRSKLRNGAAVAARTVTKQQQQQQVMPHNEFIDRIRKSLYFGAETLCDDMEVSRPLAEYASELFSEPHRGHSLNRLHSVAAGSVHASPCSLIMALIYLDRINLSEPCFTRCITPQELFIVSMMISTKFYAGHDEEIYLSDWAEDGDITEERLKHLELQFLCAIDWNIYISNQQFFEKLTTVEKILAKREGLKRGWLTYTELIQMLPSFTLAKFLFNQVTLVAFGYAASMMTLASALFLAGQLPTMNPTNNSSMRNNTEVTTTLTIATNDHVNDDLMPNNSVPILQKRLNDTVALDVQVELLQLEQQYREEARISHIKQNTMELAYDMFMSFLKTTTGVFAAKQNAVTQKEHLDMQHNWLSLKEQYSDHVNDANERLKMQKKISQNKQHIAIMSKCSNITFWHVILDVTQLSLEHLPIIWFKFI